MAAETNDHHAGGGWGVGRGCVCEVYTSHLFSHSPGGQSQASGCGRTLTPVQTLREDPFWPLPAPAGSTRSSACGCLLLLQSLLLSSQGHLGSVCLFKDTCHWIEGPLD